MSQRKRKHTRRPHSSHRSVDDSDTNLKTLYVGVMKSKFPNYITSTHLQQHFSDFEDEIEKAMIIRNLKTKESKGHGLVIFTSHEAAENAMSALKGTKLRGKFPLFMRLEPRKKPESSKRDATPDPSSCELFFRAMKSKLPNHIQNKQIREHFAEFEANIVSVVVVRDKETKQSKGFGFVKFTSHQVAINAQKKLHGSMLQGKFHLYVNMRKSSESSTRSESASLADNDSFVTDLSDSDDFSDSFETESDSDSEDSEIDDKCTLYVGVWNSKFPNFVNNAHLETHFSDFSEHISNVRIIRDRTTRETKGYGFVSFTSAAEAERAMRELRSTKLLGKFTLYIDISHQKSTSHKSDSLSVSNSSLRAERPLETQIPHSKTFQLRPEASSLEGLQAACREIGSRNRTRVVKQGGHAIVIHGCSQEGIEKSWKAIKEFVEHTLTVTKHIQVSYGYAKFLQEKDIANLQELRKHCEVLIPPGPYYWGSIEITIKGTKTAADEVLSKLRKLSSKCHIEFFEMQCPRNCARLWQNRWDRFSTTFAKRPNVLIDFQTTKTATTKAGKNTVTVLIAGTNKSAVEVLKEKVLENENCSLMSQKTIKFSNEEFDAVSSNLEELELSLEQNHSTVISLQRQAKIVQLQAPSALEASIDHALQEVKKMISKFCENRTIVTEHCFEDVVVGMLLTTKPQYCEEIKKQASQRSVILHVQKKPTPSIQLRGSSNDIKAIEEKISSLTKAAQRSIDQIQIVAGMSTHLLLTTEAFSKYQEEQLEKMFMSVSYPPQQGLLRQKLLCTSAGHMITLQLCVGNITTENVDAIFIDVDQVESVTDFQFRMKFREYVRNNGKQPKGSAICHESGTLPCRNVIVVSIPQSHEVTSGAFHHSLLSAYKESLIYSDQKAFGVISFPFLRSNDAAPSVSDELTELLPYVVDNFRATHPRTSIHTIRRVVDSEASAFCTTVFDEVVVDLDHTMDESVSESSVKPSSSPSSPSLSLQWQWCDDKNQFTSYPPDISARLTQTVHSNPDGKCFFKISGKNYVIDFTTMKQKNLSTGFTRDVQCFNIPTSKQNSDRSPQSSVTTIQWHYMDDRNVLTPYSTEDSALIEKMYNGLSKSGASIVINRRRYTFDFTKMKQINSSTHHSRNIQRKCSESASNEIEEDSPCPENQKLVITLRGPKINLVKAKAMVDMKLNELRYTTIVPLPQAASNQLQQKLHAIIRKHTVDYRIKDNFTSKGSAASPHKPCKAFEIEGPESAVHKAVTEIQAEIINFHSETPSVAGAAIEYPKVWVPQTKTTEIFKLSLLMEERCQIASKLKETLPNARIISVQRIQNKWLWEKYEQSKRRISEKNSGRVNEKQLFHGSRNTRAEKIYDSEEGFDMRFSSQGMWGRANYFAVDASYSDSYAYVNPDGSKELLLAMVLTGDSYPSKSDKTLRMPPEKVHHDHGNVQLKQVRYDTVNGVTMNTQVFMTYSNDKAYPAYLIVYSNTPSPTPTQPATLAVTTVGRISASQRLRARRASHFARVRDAVKLI